MSKTCKRRKPKLATKSQELSPKQNQSFLQDEMEGIPSGGFLEFTTRKNVLVNGKYKVIRKLGAGSFGELFLGRRKGMPLMFLAVDLITNAEIAIKTEPSRTEHPQLEYEVRVYKALAGGGIDLFMF